jgi:hypothetical protein
VTGDDASSSALVARSGWDMLLVQHVVLCLSAS